jgi:hypothetical protein
MTSAGCAIACPALVVGIGGIIALTAARNLNGVAPSETLFCANTPFVDPTTNVPFNIDFVGNPPNASSLNYAGFYPTE